jgi:hypothetical protein
MKHLPQSEPSLLARDEGYWQNVASRYDIEPGPINLEYGYFGRMTRTVAERYQAHIRRSTEAIHCRCVSSSIRSAPCRSTPP